MGDVAFVCGAFLGGKCSFYNIVLVVAAVIFPNVKVFGLDLGIVVFGHKVLAIGHPLFSHCPNFIQ